MESDFNCWPTSSTFMWEPSLVAKKRLFLSSFRRQETHPHACPSWLHFHSRTTRDRPQENKQIITIWLSQAKKSHWKSHYDGISFPQFLQNFRFEGMQTAAGHALQKLVEFWVHGGRRRGRKSYFNGSYPPHGEGNLHKWQNHRSSVGWSAPGEDFWK